MLDWLVLLASVGTVLVPLAVVQLFRWRRLDRRARRKLPGYLLAVLTLSGLLAWYAAARPQLFRLPALVLVALAGSIGYICLRLLRRLF